MKYKFINIAPQQKLKSQTKGKKTLRLLKTLKNAMIIFFCLSSSSFASAENILNIGEGVNLIALNGKEVNSDSFFNNSTAYKIPNGLNQIMVNYTAEIKNGSKYELEDTKSFVLLFEHSNGQLIISAPKIKKISDISKFEQSANWNLMTLTGEKISFKSALIEVNGFQLSRDYERELEDFNKTDSEAALPKNKKFNAAQITKTSSSANNNNTDTKENMPAQMLIFWYNQADEATRKSFKQLINNQ